MAVDRTTSFKRCCWCDQDVPVDDQAYDFGRAVDGTVHNLCACRICDTARNAQRALIQKQVKEALGE